MKPDLSTALKPARWAGFSLLVMGVCLLGLCLGCSAPPETQLAPTVGIAPGAPTAALVSPSPPTRLPTPTATLFRLASPSPTPSLTAAPRLPSSTPACEDGLRFLADITVPDGTIVAPGERIDKQWQVENIGSCNWNEAYRLRRISGPPLEVPDEQALYPARSGTQVVIRILLVAPTEPGTYRSAWQAFNPSGEPFGDPIFVEILVSSSSP